MELVADLAASPDGLADRKESHKWREQREEAHNCSQTVDCYHNVHCIQIMYQQSTDEHWTCTHALSPTKITVIQATPTVSQCVPGAVLTHGVVKVVKQQQDKADES